MIRFMTFTVDQLSKATERVNLYAIESVRFHELSRGSAQAATVTMVSGRRFALRLPEYESLMKNLNLLEGGNL